jgi:hypothetical protein
MLALSTAQRLRAAGLIWTPALHDFFALPDRGLDDRVFVLSDMSVDMELLKGQSIVTFNGTSEWALDYELTSEVVWMPTEEQLRGALERRLAPGELPPLKLIHAPDGYWCEIRLAGQSLSFRATEASEAYAEALLYVLEKNP